MQNSTNNTTNSGTSPPQTALASGDGAGRSPGADLRPTPGSAPAGRGAHCIGSREPPESQWQAGAFSWRCQGRRLVNVPADLAPKPERLRLLNTGIEVLTPASLISYKDSLRDFYIFQAQRLVSFDLAVTGLHPELTTIRIQQTMLEHWPDLSAFQQDRILTSLDLDNNKIASLGSQPINIRTELLNLGFNLISSIDESTFNGSEIGILSLSGNRQLHFIHQNALANLKNLVTLDLSGTSLVRLPSAGLQQLRTLLIRDTWTLKQIPSIYSLPSLVEAHLTYAHHCCAFHYPRAHDPSAYEEHLRVQATIDALCKAGASLQAGAGSRSGPVVVAGAPAPSSSANEFEGEFEGSAGARELANGDESLVLVLTTSAPASTPTSTNSSTSTTPTSSSVSPARQRAAPLALVAPGRPLDPPPSPSAPPASSFHTIECGEIAARRETDRNISCTPEPDAFNPCEDIMGYSVLRVAVWFVVGASVLANLSVIVVLMSIFRKLTVPKFLQLNLAIGDLFMGVYLASLALADLFTGGAYFNYAIDWQYGAGCKFAGAASLFASQLSIFTLSVITFERYYTITYSIDLNMRLHLGWAARIMFIGWLFAASSAMLPALGNINSYSKTSICLPMRTSRLSDRVFILVLLLIDSSAFVIIFACYLRMYLLILSQKTQANVKERTVAMRMALLVFTDFACWAPIIFFSTTALFQRPLISVTNSKILIVFFYPLNSLANPFLYAISTRQYRSDLTSLSARLQVWRHNLFNRHADSYYTPASNAHGPGHQPVAGAIHRGHQHHQHHNHHHQGQFSARKQHHQLRAAAGARPCRLQLLPKDGAALEGGAAAPRQAANGHLASSEQGAANKCNHHHHQAHGQRGSGRLHLHHHHHHHHLLQTNHRRHERRGSRTNALMWLETPEPVGQVAVGAPQDSAGPIECEAGATDRQQPAGERRIVCSKAATRDGHYIIRHQILAASPTPTMRSPDKMRPSRARVQRQFGSDEHEKSIQEQIEEEAEEEVEAEAETGNGKETPSASQSHDERKLLNGSSANSNEPDALMISTAVSREPQLAASPKKSPPDERDRQASCDSLVAVCRNRCCACCAPCRRYSTASKVAVSASSGAHRKTSSARRNSSSTTTNQLKMVTLITTLPITTSSEPSGCPPKTGQSNSESRKSNLLRPLVEPSSCPSLDILGNLSSDVHLPVSSSTSETTREPTDGPDLSPKRSRCHKHHKNHHHHHHHHHHRHYQQDHKHHRHTRDHDGDVMANCIAVNHNGRLDQAGESAKDGLANQKEAGHRAAAPNRYCKAFSPTSKQANSVGRPKKRLAKVNGCSRCRDVAAPVSVSVSDHDREQQEKLDEGFRESKISSASNDVMQTASQ